MSKLNKRASRVSSYLSRVMRDKRFSKENKSNAGKAFAALRHHKK